MSYLDFTDDIRSDLNTDSCLLYYHTRRGRSRGGACRRRPNFEGAKGAKFRRKPPFLFVSEQSRMSTLSVQKV